MNYLKNFSKGGKSFIGNFPILIDSSICPNNNFLYNKIDTKNVISENCNCEAAGYSSTFKACSSDNVYMLQCHTGEILTCYDVCRGCTDENALNYDPNATEQYGDCCYGYAICRPFLNSDNGCYYDNKTTTSTASQDYSDDRFSWNSVYLGSYESIKTETVDMTGSITTNYTGRTDWLYKEYDKTNGTLHRTVSSYMDQDINGVWTGFLFDSFNLDPHGFPYPLPMTGLYSPSQTIFTTYSSLYGPPVISDIYSYNTNSNIGECS